jgi:serine/threonine protein kinase
MSPKSKRLRKISKYDIKDRIGSGSMGVVYEAYDPFVQRTVAIKVSHSQEGLSANISQKMRESFFSEVYSAGKMHHPSVVSVFDAGQENDHNYIVMEYVDGVTLQDYVAGKKKLSPHQVLDVIYQCAKGLDYVHRQNVIHRDIKPGNIMLSNEGEVKIMDFSIAHIDIGVDDYNTEVHGSPMYMPPEQLSEEKRLVAQSDVYSLGAVMYALLARKAPFKASSLESLIYQIGNLEPEPLSELCPDIPEYISDIVDKAMNKIIYHRYESALAFANDLSRSFGRLRKVGERIDMAEKWTTLRYLNFFKEFSDEQISEVVDASEWKDFKKGNVIVSEGEKETAFYIIAKGGVNVMKKDKIIGIMKQGDCFGEIAFITRKPRAATIAARTDVSLMVVSMSLMEKASLETQLQYYRIFLGNLISRLSQATDKMSASDKAISET